MKITSYRRIRIEGRALHGTASLIDSSVVTILMPDHRRPLFFADADLDQTPPVFSNPLPATWNDRGEVEVTRPLLPGADTEMFAVYFMEERRRDMPFEYCAQREDEYVNGNGGRVVSTGGFDARHWPPPHWNPPPRFGLHLSAEERQPLRAVLVELQQNSVSRRHDVRVVR